MHTTLPPAIMGIATALCLCGAVVAAAHLLRPHPTEHALYSGRASDLNHLAMLTAMAVMWSDTSLPITLWRAVFGALAASALLALLTRGYAGSRTERIGSAAYHCVSALAMLYAGSAHHTVSLPVLGWTLTALFLLDAAVVAAVAVTPATPSRRDFLVTVFPHLVMDLAMASMLAVVLV
ncbi:DUF5134 domain-containing protein [Nocardia jejuensis]|uniref:DUF5134 domain-containing protein n=1 Tax=Nocardia jejuensis TaxID=328049 RepID=UPI000834B268|nr:DUF5134 domain-containing protein [Nocardia jejuensis]